MAIRLTRKKAALGIVAVVMILAVSAGVWVLKTQRSAQKAAGITTEMAPLDDVPGTAFGYAQNGDIDGGMAYYDSQIQQRKDATEKVRLLLYKSNFAVEVKRYKEAVDAAKQADAIKSDISTAVALARAYEGSGDKRQALIYYKKALDASPKDGMGARDNYLWEQKIKELQS